MFKLPAHTSDAAHAIEDDVPKRIEMRFIYKHVTRQQAVDALQWRLVESPAAASIQDQVQLFVSWLGDFERGDQIVFDYVPGKGTSVTLKGESIAEEFQQIVSDYVARTYGKREETAAASL